MANAIYLDWDGTLISAGKRLYTLFQELVPQSTFTYAEYWEIKRRRTNQAELLGRWFGFTEEQLTAFKKEWLAKVEEPHRLLQDEPLPGTGALLERLADKHPLYIVTARQNPDSVQAQIERFGWSKHFTNVLVTRQSSTKTELIRQHTQPQNGDIFVGDTGEDIHTAREVGLIAVAVASGFLNAEILQTYNPDYLLESVTQLHETHLI